MAGVVAGRRVGGLAGGLVELFGIDSNSGEPAEHREGQQSRGTASRDRKSDVQGKTVDLGGPRIIPTEPK